MQFIVYGCGAKAKAIISKNPEQVYGVMDLYKTGQIFCGKQVLSDDEIVASGIKTIVIAARKANIPIIYRRIAKFLEENSIKALDDNFDSVSSNHHNDDELCFQHNEVFTKEIKEKILSVDVVSFDVFDTVIGRRVLYSSDISEAFNNEKMWVYPRKEIVNYYDYASEAGKKIVFCSDMYLTSNQISELLCDCGLHVSPNEVVVSCEHGVEKVDGLFDVLKSKVKTDSILHIGDSIEADYDAPIRYGIPAVKIDNRLDVLEKSKWRKLLLFDTNPHNRRVLGELLASDLTIADFISPLIYKFASWIKENSKELDFVLLSSRDGWLLEVLRNEFSEYFYKGCYFLISRTAAVSASIYNKDDFDEAVNYNFSGDMKDLYEKRFAMDCVSEVSNVLINSKRLRHNYLRYIEQLNISSDAKVGFVDLVAAGTCIKNLRRIAPFQLVGLNMACIEEFSLHNENDNFLFERSSGNNVLSKYFILEQFLSSDMPTLKHFDENGNPVYFAERRSQDNLKHKNEIQNSIVKYGKNTLDIDFAEVSLALCDEILGMVELVPDIVEDEFCGR